MGESGRLGTRKVTKIRVNWGEMIMLEVSGIGEVSGVREVK